MSKNENSFVFRDSVNLQYRFTLQLIFKEFQSAIRLLDETGTLSGRIMKKIYGSQMTSNDPKYFDVCNMLSHKLDCLLMIQFGKSKDMFYSTFEDECASLATPFHLSGNDVAFVYMVAGATLAFESLFFEDSRIMFMELNEEAREFYTEMLEEILSSLGTDDVYLCIYNLLEGSGDTDISVRRISFTKGLDVLKSLCSIEYDEDSYPVLVNSDGIFTIDLIQDRIEEFTPGHEDIFPISIRGNVKLFTFNKKTHHLTKEFEFKSYFHDHSLELYQEDYEIDMPDITTRNSSLIFGGPRFVKCCTFFTLSSSDMDGNEEL